MSDPIDYSTVALPLGTDEERVAACLTFCRGIGSVDVDSHVDVGSAPIPDRVDVLHKFAQRGATENQTSAWRFTTAAREYHLQVQRMPEMGFCGVVLVGRDTAAELTNAITAW